MILLCCSIFSVIVAKPLQQKQELRVEKALPQDLSAMVQLAMQRHYQYANYQKVFWKVAKDAKYQQRIYFTKQLKNSNAIMLVTKCNQQVVGMLLAHLFKEPPVYDSGVTTYIVDDFVVKSPDMWSYVGPKMLKTLMEYLHEHNVDQIIVMVAHKDKNKRNMLKSFKNLSIMTEWWTGNT